MKRLLLLLMLVLGFAVPSTVMAEPKRPSDEELSKSTFAVLTGTTAGPEVEEYFPGATIEYYNTTSDVIAVMRAGKADITLGDKGMLRAAQIENKDLVLVGDPCQKSTCAPHFRRLTRGRRCVRSTAHM